LKNGSDQFSGGKRKASEEPSTPESKQRSKKARTDSPERYAQDEAPERQPLKLIPYPEKPAVLEERCGDIEFRVVNNDGSRESFIILTGLKCIFQKQLPKMPKDYIARLVYDRTHLSMAIVKHPLEVVGYVGAKLHLNMHLRFNQRHHLPPIQGKKIRRNCILCHFV